MSWMDAVRFDERGLVPVVAQEARTGEVLMLAWANREALEATARTGRAHYWSRSRAALWEKGATSGNAQAIRTILLDCDSDAVLYHVEQTGAACHTGAHTCFVAVAGDEEFPAAAPDASVLDRIAEVVARRDEQRPPDSYTTYLFERGLDKILKKIGEEATETIIAAKNPDAAELRAEAADLLFHLLILLRARNLPPTEVYGELARRFGAPPRAGATAPPPSRAADGT